MTTYNDYDHHSFKKLWWRGPITEAWAHPEEALLDAGRSAGAPQSVQGDDDENDDDDDGDEGDND